MRTTYVERIEQDRQCLAFIELCFFERGESPSYGEIARRLNLKCRESAKQIVTRLRQRKLLSRSYSVRGAKGSTWGGLRIHQSPEASA